MECASLERYLEAYLEGRLRRAQWLVLRRHVMTCPSCRARVEELRQFEVDLHQRFRAMARTQRLWTGLELDLVGLPSAAGSSDLLPPRAPRPPMTSLTGALLPPPSRSRSSVPATPPDAPVREPRWSVVALLCLVLAGVSTGGWVLIRSNPQTTEDTGGDLRLLGSADPVDAASATEAVAAPFEEAGTGSPAAAPVDLAQIDVQPAEVPDWLQVQLGRPVDLALPPGITLLGGGELRIGMESRPVVLAAGRDDDRLMLLPTVDGMSSVSADVVAYARRHGLAHMIRRHEGVTFDVLGSVSPGRLDELFFAPLSSD